MNDNIGDLKDEKGECIVPLRFQVASSLFAAALLALFAYAASNSQQNPGRKNMSPPLAPATTQNSLDY